MRMTAAAVVAGVRRRPGRALAVCAALVAASVIAGTSVASAGPQASLALTRAQLHAAPAPLVMNWDNHLSGRQVVSHNKGWSVPAKWNIDGCDHDYGAPTMCVPWKIPAPNPQAACSWLKAHGFGPLKVYGINRQHLPENADGYVCATTT
jgi:hypothetical protein